MLDTTNSPPLLPKPYSIAEPLDPACGHQLMDDHMDCDIGGLIVDPGCITVTDDTTREFISSETCGDVDIHDIRDSRQNNTSPTTQQTLNGEDVEEELAVSGDEANELVVERDDDQIICEEHRRGFTTYTSIKNIDIEPIPHLASGLEDTLNDFSRKVELHVAQTDVLATTNDAPPTHDTEHELYVNHRWFIIDCNGQKPLACIWKRRKLQFIAT